MLEVSTIGQLRAWRRARREEGRRVALVPTMGALHEGHLALVDAARRSADAVVMSIFVNPLQFAPNEDLARYPRNLERDRALARERGVDLLFVPGVDAMYPPGASTRVVPGDLAGRWEGSARPGHFAGVLTVVAKLFHLTEPDVACFGQKDIQQFTLIRQMVRDLDWNLRLERVPIVREADGLALSSRNVYLSPTERREAAALHAALTAASTAYAAGEQHAGRLAERVRATLELQGGLSADYIAVVEPEEMLPIATAEPGTIIAIAVRVGATRLIDNVILGED
ncbi:MAG TPA: pantoate--beta-alanine ligase [Gemmatimonadales bacterium]|nr:pantoate--beta-alanine ligase [Gemmatimonadales bacterium]